MIEIFRNIVFVVGCISLSACQGEDVPNVVYVEEEISVDGQQFVSISEVSRQINAGDIDRIITSLNIIKRMDYQTGHFSFIEDLWEGDTEKRPNLNWEVVNRDVVKVEVANLLAQASRNGYIDVDLPELHRYVRTLLDSTDLRVVRAAVLTLSVFDDCQDLHPLLAEALKNRKATFRSSVVALSVSCCQSAGDVLDELEESVKREKDRLYISEMREKNVSYKDLVCRL